MKKRLIIISSIWSVILLAFILVLSFVFDLTTEYYFKCLVFTIIAYAVSLVQILRGIKKEKKLRSYPFYFTGPIYFGLQIALSIISILCHFNFTTFLVIEDVLLLVYVISGFLIFILKEKKFFYDKYRSKQKNRVDNLINILVEINRKNISDEAKDAVLSLMDNLTNSEQITHKDATDLENEIINQINALEILAEAENDDELIKKCNEINELLNKRNEVVQEKLLK